VKVTNRETVHSGFYSVVDLKSMTDSTPKSSLKPVLSMGELHSTQGGLMDQSQARVSTNLNEFLGAIDQDDGDEEDIFF